MNTTLEANKEYKYITVDDKEYTYTLYSGKIGAVNKATGYTASQRVIERASFDEDVYFWQLTLDGEEYGDWVIVSQPSIQFGLLPELTAQAQVERTILTLKKKLKNFS